MNRFLALMILFLSAETFSQVERFEPPNWWVGFKESHLQLLVKVDGISAYEPHIDYKGVSIEKVHKAKSPNYLFIDLNIEKDARPGSFDIVFKSKKGKTKTHTYQLKARAKAADDFEGFNSSDVIYLITPDRFVNGDPSNDVDTSLREKSINRQDDYARHGGDIKGIIDHLDYIEQMGFTTIWPTPLLTNDMPEASYHGYAITDYYQVDSRFGTLDDYKELADKIHRKDMKLIMDMVANHCGSYHWWMNDLPFDDWVNQQQAYENGKAVKNSNHRRTVNQDLYAAQYDEEEMNQGWFVSTMPDLNQRNPFLAKYIIQNNIWWIETLQLDGIRQDTYPYPDKEFMSEWAGTIMKEYPNFNIVGEEWSLNPLLVRYWQEGTPNKEEYVSNLKSTMDFPMQRAIVEALNEEEVWGKGLVKMYEGLANDFAYTSPENIMLFPDNHDMDRIFTQLNEDVTNTKMALAYIMTLPRIPQIYYGTEVLIDNSEKPNDHGLIRTDFPGGWNGDTINGFTGKGLSGNQKEFQEFLKSLLSFRKNSKAIHKGKTVHFSPLNGTYILFRILDDEVVVLILNKNKEPITLDLNRYEEIGLKGKTLKNIISGDDFQWSDKITLKERGVTLMTTKL